MAQQCFQNEYFDSLLHACKPCHLRCSNTPPAMCQRYCNASMSTAAKATNAVLWACLGLSLVSLAVLMLVFLLRKMSWEPLKDEFKHTGSVLLDVTNANLDKSRVGENVILPRSLGYTVEECTCEDCVNSKPTGEADHFFPLPAMEEGATILVTTKTNDYCKSLPAASSATGIEKSISTR
ncbi:tumor necrosis factor receptor superfamily member 17 [Castor canadensis]|uniref:Tumor necrosis factor receptor superfamily member 17 n=1 Tax=Castor canadensis TaxID=51338 RepID=A0A8B7UT44_CASCN|nr:tumor necrosis factor receptor superfamily member 17 [Castor canadensis]